MKIDVQVASPYSVFIENGIIERTGAIAKGLVKPGAKILIVSETNVYPLYGKYLENSLKAEGFKVYKYIFDAGEESKKLSTVYSIYQSLAENGFTRSDGIVTLGGGVAGDMGGFAAATYLRGIGFIQVPTSLLAQVDASVGGKTGVDLPMGKNLVGAFHQPLAVLIDPKALKTLPKYYFNDGLGEVIKYGCISDAALFAELENGIENEKIEHIIAQCVNCKKELVEIDTKDTGRRMILNFGHTFGHALEKLHDFKELSHGYAVGIGMIMMARVGENLGITEIGTAERIAALLQKYGLPCEDRYTKEEIVAATLLDKKSDGDKLNIVLIEKIGTSVVHQIDRSRLYEVM